MKKYTGNNNINDIFFEIVCMLLSDDKQESIDLKKLLIYGNKKDKSTGNITYINPYKCKEVTEELYNKNIYQYDYIFDIQKETRNIINIHLAGGRMGNYNHYTEEDYFIVDIYVHKDMEAVNIDGKRIARSIEILNKVRAILDGTKIPKALTTLELKDFNCGKIQDTYIKTSCVFKIKNIR